MPINNAFISQTNLLPNRDFDQHEVLPYFSLRGTGLGGQLVTFLTGAQDPIQSEGYGTAQVAAPYVNIYSPLYTVARQVRVAAVGDTKWEVAGLTLYTTALRDENGNLLLNVPDDVAAARSFVKTGQAVPIVKRGQFTVFLSQFNGTTPYAGYPLVASGTNGGFACISPAVATGSSVAPFVVGRCISSTGTYNGVGSFGGFAQIEIAL